MTKKSKTIKLTESLKAKIKAEFVQGQELKSGERKIYTLDELIKKHKVASATLYRAARAEGWKALREEFDQQVLDQLNAERSKAMAKKGKQFDDNFLSQAEKIIKQVDTYFKVNQECLDMRTKVYPPHHLLALCNALLTAQKLSKIALGEATEKIDVNATAKEAETFRRFMDSLHDIKRERVSGSRDSLH